MRVSLLLALLCAARFAVADDQVAERARVNYMLNCQGCHLPDGSGFPGKVPDMRGLVGRFPTVAGGREFLVRVPGSANAPLSDERLAELMNWLLREYGGDQLPADFRPYAAEEVGRLRRHPLTDVQGERQRLLTLLGRSGG
jgi:mono/diheme cytochrome c family protein